MGLALAAFEIKQTALWRRPDWPQERHFPSANADVVTYVVNVDVDVAPTAPTGAPTRTQELRPPPGWGNAECGFYMLRHASMLTGA